MHKVYIATIAALVVVVGIVWYVKGSKAPTPTAAAPTAAAVDPKASFEAAAKNFVEQLKAEMATRAHHSVGEPQIDVSKTDSLTTPYVGTLRLLLVTHNYHYDCTFGFGMSDKWQLRTGTAIQWLPGLPWQKERVDLLNDPTALPIETARRKAGL